MALDLVSLNDPYFFPAIYQLETDVVFMIYFIFSPAMENQLHARDKVGVQDFTLLEDYTNENAFINNLHKRFQGNLIYVSFFSQMK